MIKTWRDNPDCPADWEDRIRWNSTHRCGDCIDFFECPCGCGWGWCQLDDSVYERTERCCGEGVPRSDGL